MTHTKKYILQFLPPALEEDSKCKKILYKGVNLKTAYLIDIVHNLLLKYYFKKRNLFKLSSKVLKSKYGSNYNFYISYLVEKNILILISDYFAGNHSRIYEINSDIISSDMRRFENKDNIILKKYKISNNKENTSIDSNTRIRLISDLYFVKIDYEKSLDYLNSNFINDKEMYMKNIYSVESIKEGNIFYNFDAYGRFHTNYTILKSHIRKNFLNISDEKVVEIDIHNSQPLFLSKLIQENDINIVDKKEFENFAELTYSGKFYSYVMQNSVFKEKKIIKEMIYRVFFGKNFNFETDIVFSKLFPTIFEFIKAYKKDYGNYRILSHDLQKMESNFIFNKVIKRIYESNKDIKLITIHDSIIFQECYKPIVEIIFQEELEKEFSFISHDNLINK